MSSACQQCGACCAHFRVSFYWTEADPFVGGGVPAELTCRITPHLCAMQGTEGKAPRCVGLAGDIGQGVSCMIYSQRPSPCRELQAAWVDAQPSPQCDKARLAHGLPPLLPSVRITA